MNDFRKGSFEEFIKMMTNDNIIGKPRVNNLHGMMDTDNVPTYMGHINPLQSLVDMQTLELLSAFEGLINMVADFLKKIGYDGKFDNLMEDIDNKKFKFIKIDELAKLNNELNRLQKIEMDFINQVGIDVKKCVSDIEKGLIHFGYKDLSDEEIRKATQKTEQNKYSNIKEENNKLIELNNDIINKNMELINEKEQLLNYNAALEKEITEYKKKYDDDYDDESVNYRSPC